MQLDIALLTKVVVCAGALLFLGGAVVEDVFARANAREGLTWTAFLVRPLHLFDPKLYTERGELHRRGAVRYLVGFLVCAVILGCIAALEF